MTPDRAKELIEKWPDIQISEDERKEVWEIYDKNIKEFNSKTSFLIILNWIANGEI